MKKSKLLSLAGLATILCLGLAACNAGSGGGSTNVGSLGTLTVTTAPTTINLGESTTFTATLVNVVQADVTFSNVVVNFIYSPLNDSADILRASCTIPIVTVAGPNTCSVKSALLNESGTWEVVANSPTYYPQPTGDITMVVNP